MAAGLGDGVAVGDDVALGVSAWPDGPPLSSSPKPPEPPGLNVTDTLRGPVIVTVQRFFVKCGVKVKSDENGHQLDRVHG